MSGRLWLLAVLVAGIVLFAGLVVHERSLAAEPKDVAAEATAAGHWLGVWRVLSANPVVLMLVARDDAMPLWQCEQRAEEVREAAPGHAVMCIAEPPP